MFDSVRLGSEMRKPAPSSYAQRGAAVLSALLIAALTTILVSGLLWQQQVQIRSIENLKLRGQAVFLQQGVLDWIRLILRDDLRTSGQKDHLGEAWAVTIAETPLNDFLGQQGIEDEAAKSTSVYLSGRISDAQARFNLTNILNIVATDDQAPLIATGLRKDGINQFKQLLSVLGLNPDMAESIGQHMWRSLQAAGNDTQSKLPRPLDDPRDLLSIPGIDAKFIARLAPQIVILPRATPANVNTASPEVLVAAINGLSLSGAQQLVQRRERSPFNNLGDVKNVLNSIQEGLEPEATAVSVSTEYFNVAMNVRNARAMVSRTVLVARLQNGNNSATRVLRIRDTDEISP